MPSSPQISFIWPAMSRHICSDSATQGPAMRKKGWSRPTSKSHSFITHSFGLGRLARQRRLHVGGEQGMTLARIGGEFGMELAADEPGMDLGRQLDHFA